MKGLILTLSLFFSMGFAQNFNPIQWSVPAELQGGIDHLGYAGMAAAKISGGFLFGGGGNFPNGLPWEGGKKIYTDKLFFWNESSQSPETLNLKLPKAGGYFAYTGFENQLVIAGGDTANGLTNKAYEISKDKVLELPSLPIAVVSAAMVQKGGVLYLAGGDEATKTSTGFYALNLKDTKKGWQKLMDLPYPTASASIFLVDNKIYLLGGRSKNPNGISTLNNGILVYDFKNKNWKQEGEIQIDGRVSPFTAPGYFTYENRFLILAGGDDGKIFHQIETYIAEIKTAKTEAEKAELNKQKSYLVEYHLGFNNKVLIYDTKEKKWLRSQLLPYPAQVTSASAQEGNKLFIFNGEVRPGVRSPRILEGIIEKR